MALNTSGSQTPTPTTSLQTYFKDSFSGTGSTLDAWDVVHTGTSSANYAFAGNSSGASYLKLFMDGTLAPGSQIELLSKYKSKVPFRYNLGLTLSQRIAGEEISVEMVGVNEDGSIEEVATPAPLVISGTVSITSNVATINFASNHNLVGNQRVVIAGNAESRLNVGPVVVTVVTPTQITVPCTLANGTYTAGGFVYLADYADFANNASVINFENTTATNASVAVKSFGKSARFLSAQTILSTAGVQTNTSPYTDSWNVTNELETVCNDEEFTVLSRVVDNTATAPVTLLRLNQVSLDYSKSYKMRIRFKRFQNYSGIVGTSISAISKAGTTTATVTTSTPHGLTTGNFVQIYGVLDQTNFANLTTAATITVVDANNFTVVLGSAVTASSSGGVVCLNNGSVTLPGAINLAIASISRTAGLLTVTMNTTSSGLVAGETCCLCGMTGSAAAYNGPYKVLNQTGSTYVLESNGPDFGSIATGGAVTKLTDVRLHYVKILEYAKQLVEIANARGMSQDRQRAMSIIGDIGTVSTVTTCSTVTTVSTVSTVSAVTSANKAIPGIIADIASGALTTTTTTAAVTPTFGNTYTVMMAVTAVSGTSPTLDVQVQESDDTGTNWYAVYDFPRITATGAYRSPALKLMGNRVRYVQTVAGTTPSFTRSLNRLQCSFEESYTYRQLIDRSIVLTTLNSTTPSLFLAHTYQVTLVINVGAITTTAPALQLEGSDDNGASWYSLGTPLTAVASSTVIVNVVETSPQLLRARVSTAGVGVTAGYVLIKGS